MAHLTGATAAGDPMRVWHLMSYPVSYVISHQRGAGAAPHSLQLQATVCRGPRWWPLGPLGEAPPPRPFCLGPSLALFETHGGRHKGHRGGGMFHDGRGSGPLVPRAVPSVCCWPRSFVCVCGRGGGHCGGRGERVLALRTRHVALWVTTAGPPRTWRRMCRRRCSCLRRRRACRTPKRISILSGVCGAFLVRCVDRPMGIWDHVGAEVRGLRRLPGCRCGKPPRATHPRCSWRSSPESTAGEPKMT